MTTADNDLHEHKHKWYYPCSLADLVTVGCAVPVSHERERAALQRIVRRVGIRLQERVAIEVEQRRSRDGRNPKTGMQVSIEAKKVPVFKAGKELRERVDKGPSE